MKIQMRIQILHFYHAKLWYELWRFEVANNKKFRQIKMVHYKTEQSKRFECAKQRTFLYDFQRWNLKPIPSVFPLNSDDIFLQKFKGERFILHEYFKTVFFSFGSFCCSKDFFLVKTIICANEYFFLFFALFRRAPREKIYSSKANQIDKSQFLQTDFSKI